MASGNRAQSDDRSPETRVGPAGRDVNDDTGILSLPAAEHTDAEVERRDEAAHVQGALTALPAEKRQVIELAYFDGLSHREIAASLGHPVGTVKSRMRHALSKLRDELTATAEAIP